MAYKKVKRRTARRWTDAEIAQVKMFIESGMSDKKIGREIGRSEGAIKIFRRFGRPSTPADFKSTGKNRPRRSKVPTWNGTTALAERLTPKQSKDKAVLLDLIFNSDIPKHQKLTCLEALL